MTWSTRCSATSHSPKSQLRMSRTNSSPPGGDGVAAPDRFPQAIGHLDQEEVAGVVAEVSLTGLKPSRSR